MFKKYKILVLGGDERYLEIISGLAKNQATIYTIGYDHLTFDATNIKQTDEQSVDLKSIDYILLPVSGTGTKGEIETTYSDTPTYINEHILKQTPQHCQIITGISTPYLEEIANKQKRQIKTLFTRDDVAILNSIPTAEGTLSIVIENTEYTVHRSKVIVFGFGRIGKTIARLFSNVGAQVTVYVRHTEDEARLFEMGLSAMTEAEVHKEIHRFDICINTIPSPIIDKALLDRMDQETLIIDLASAPGGVDFAYAQELEIKAIHALGLPGKTAPKTAGKILYQAIEDIMQSSM